MIGEQRQVEREREPLGRAEEHHAEEEMDEILRENQLKNRAKQKQHVKIHEHLTVKRLVLILVYCQSNCLTKDLIIHRSYRDNEASLQRAI